MLDVSPLKPLKSTMETRQHIEHKRRESCKYKWNERRLRGAEYTFSSFIFLVVAFLVDQIVSHIIALLAIGVTSSGSGHILKNSLACPSYNLFCLACLFYVWKTNTFKHIHFFSSSYLCVWICTNVQICLFSFTLLAETRPLFILLISINIWLSFQLATVPTKAAAASDQWLLGHLCCCHDPGRIYIFIYLIFLLLVAQIAQIHVKQLNHAHIRKYDQNTNKRIFNKELTYKHWRKTHSLVQMDFAQECPCWHTS